MNLVIRLVLFNLLVAEGIESNLGPQTGSTHGNSSPRAGTRGCGPGCYGRGSRQYPFDDTFADTYVHDPAGVSNRGDPPYNLCRASRS